MGRTVGSISAFPDNHFQQLSGRKPDLEPSVGRESYILIRSKEFLVKILLPQEC